MNSPEQARREPEIADEDLLIDTLQLHQDMLAAYGSYVVAEDTEVRGTINDLPVVSMPPYFDLDIPGDAVRAVLPDVAERLQVGWVVGLQYVPQCYGFNGYDPTLGAMTTEEKRRFERPQFRESVAALNVETNDERTVYWNVLPSGDGRLLASQTSTETEPNWNDIDEADDDILEEETPHLTVQQCEDWQTILHSLRHLLSVQPKK